MRIPRLAPLALTLRLLLAGDASAGIVAMSGFNDVSGINGDGVTNNSPFNIANVSLNGQGGSEFGWKSPWTVSDGPSIVVNSGQAEGDGAVFLQNTTGIHRVLALPLDGVYSIELKLKIMNSVVSGQGANLYLRQNSNNAVGPNWQASADGHYRVVDGKEDSNPVLVDTGFTWKAGVYQTIRVDVNTLTRKWDFYVDGIKYNGPHQMGYREAPAFLDEIDFGNFIGEPNGSYVDAVVVQSIPEPSSIALITLVGLAGAAYRGSRWLRPENR